MWKKHVFIYKQGKEILSHERFSIKVRRLFLYQFMWFKLVWLRNG